MKDTSIKQFPPLGNTGQYNTCQTRRQKPMAYITLVYVADILKLNFCTTIF